MQTLAMKTIANDFLCCSFKKFCKFNQISISFLLGWKMMSVCVATCKDVGWKTNGNRYWIDVDRKRSSFTIYLCDEKRSISKCLNLLHFKWVKYSLVFGPGDELKRRMGLDVTVNDAAQMKGKVLNGWSVHNATWIWK